MTGPSLRHPRRFGFVLFNLAALALIGFWWLNRTESADAGIAGLPNAALASAGIAVVAAVWIGAWIAWGWMVWSRRRRHRAEVSG